MRVYIFARCCVDKASVSGEKQAENEHQNQKNRDICIPFGPHLRKTTRSDEFKSGSKMDLTGDYGNPNRALERG